MKQCKTIGCSNNFTSSSMHEDFCLACRQQQAVGQVTHDLDMAIHKVTQPDSSSAPDFLDAALKHMRDRAVTYDAPSGERSMAKTVAAFNALTGNTLSETEGWLFMVALKMARSTQGAFKADNFEDMAAYAGLAGESAALVG